MLPYDLCATVPLYQSVEATLVSDEYHKYDVYYVDAVFPIKDEGGRTAISQLPSGESYYPQARREDGLFVNVVYLLHFTIFHCRGLSVN